jgi:DNA-binding NarL/FixJ family response regulator
MGVRIAIAEDSFLVREALTQMLSDAPEIDLVAVCDDGTQLRRVIDTHDLDVVVTDIRMPPTGTDEGIRLAGELRITNPGMGVVVLSAYCEPLYALALLDGGSDGRAYLLKDHVHSGRQLVGTIEVVARGGSVIDAKVVQVLAESRADRHATALSRLSPRENEILIEMAHGDSNAAIGTTLGMTKRAVEKHINSIFAKLAMPPTVDTSRRVRAVLLYLAESDPVRSASDRPRPGTARPL